MFKKDDILKSFKQKNSDSTEKNIISFKNAIILSLIVLITYILVLISLTTEPSLQMIFSDLISPIVGILVFIGLFYVAKLSSIQEKRVQIAWYILSISVLFYAIGDIIWAILELALNQQPFPSIADVFYLLFYPLFALGIYYLPRNPLSQNEKLKLILDMSIIVMTALIILGIFLMIPLIYSNEDPLANIISLIYIIGDIILLFAILRILFNNFKNIYRDPLLLLGLGVSIQIITDSIYCYQLIQGTYISGGLLDGGWVLSFIIIGLAAILNANLLIHGEKHLNIPKLQRINLPSYLPLIGTILAYILLLWSNYDLISKTEIYIEIGIGIIIFLMISRQIITLNENKNLYLSAKNEITNRKKLEENLIKTNRSLRMISDCNQSLIRAKEEKKLLEEICNIIIKGNYLFTWVGYPDDNTKTLRHVAFAGKEEKYLQNINVSWDNTELGKGPSGNAYRKGKEFIINNIKLDESFAPWRNEALKRGYASVISLPLLSRGNIIGIISIYSSEIDRFDDGEVKLLRELADDLAYGIVSLRADNGLKQLIKELEENENKYHTLFDNAGDGILIIDEDKFIDCNSKALEIFGVTKKEIIGKTPFGIFSPEYQSDNELSKQKALKNINNALKGEQQLFEWEHKRLDGSIVYTEVTLNRLKIDTKYYLMAIVRDITERVESSKIIKEQLSFLNELLNTIPYPIFYKDKNYTYLGCNKAFEEYLGLSNEEIIGKTVYDVAPKDIADKNYKKDQELFENLKLQVYEGSVYHINGTKREVLFNKAPYNDIDGNVAGLIGVMVDITDLKKAHESLQESEMYYRTIFENTGTATLIFEKNGIISLANTKCEELSGYSKEEIEGKKRWIDFVADEDKERMMNFHNLRETNPDSVPQNYEFKLKNKNGDIRDVYANIVPIPHTNNRLVSLLDITDKKQSTKALRESKAKLRIAMDMAKLVSWEYDVKTDMFTFDDQFYSLYGTSIQKEDIKMMSSEEYAKRFIPPEESYLVAEEIAKTLETDDPNYFQTIEHSIIRADNEKRFILVSLGIIKDSKGQTIKIYGANQDITERKKAEIELFENEEKYRTLFNSTPDYTILIGLDGNLLDVNKAAQKIVGLSHEDLIGKNFTELDLLLDEEIPMHMEKVSRLLKGDIIKPYESRFIDKNGEIHYVECYLKSLQKEEKLFAFNVIAHDITERKKSEEKIKASLKEKEVLLKEIHHRVKNNMQIISSLLRLQSDYITDKDAVLAFKESDARIMSMALVHESIYLSENLTSIDFKNYVQKLINGLKISYNTHNIDIKLKIENIEFNIETAIPCGLIINELVSNSIKHAFQDNKGLINVKLTHKSDKYKLIINDNGIGLPEHLYDGRSNSLGLKLVKTLVIQLDGEMKIDSSNGTTFTIIFEELKYKKRL